MTIIITFPNYQLLDLCVLTGRWSRIRTGSIAPGTSTTGWFWA